MNSKTTRIVFMGTPEFAATSLEHLLCEGYNIVGVVTAVDKPAGRGMQLQESAVKKIAITHNLPILQPEKLRDEHFLSTLKDLQADLFIVVAFRMLPNLVWQMPSLGTFNLHASLLPQYRGAAPINWAIINGETRTGLTTFLLNEEIDTGKILLQEELEISPSDNVETLYNKLKERGKFLICKTIDAIVEGNLEAIPQNLSTNSPLRMAPKLFKENCQLDWAKSAIDLANQVRGLSPYPSANCNLRLNNQEYSLKIFLASAENTAHSFPQGSILSDGKTYIKVACANGFLHLEELQIAGKKRLKTDAFLRGFPLKPHNTTTAC
ncbi:MAG: methionyl-tRNA formyltransferase [Bacteroidales bacterium]